MPTDQPTNTHQTRSMEREAACGVSQEKIAITIHNYCPVPSDAKSQDHRTQASTGFVGELSHVCDAENNKGPAQASFSASELSRPDLASTANGSLSDRPAPLQVASAAAGLKALESV
ncbi:hypothetical protein E4U17_006948 [Claviceps sp. LM77 group G4]|nr:hypothetical protein E4U17_006948 [Claviceps sp. LM77 group G4]KAG6067440.1 hypothetical protein E4U33_005286 [Claviceps sp. LM78 group G4]KAG6071149.1 hypothetical protein E4U16_006343 [Claviceps sp. LM84 group G4]